MSGLRVALSTRVRNGLRFRIQGLRVYGFGLRVLRFRIQGFRT